jgi:hypothetical protein
MYGDKILNPLLNQEPEEKEEKEEEEETTE